VTVPNVVGQDQASATAAIEAKGLKTTVTTAASTAEQKGKVVSTDPAGGAQVDKGKTVSVVVGAGPNTLAVPDVTGKTVADAKTAIQQAGFTGNITVNNVDSLEDKGTVVSTNPTANSDLSPDSAITLNVSKGTVALPDLTGKTEAAARQALVDLGVKTSNIDSVTVERDDVAQGSVAGTAPPAGSPIGPGDTVTLQIASPTPPSTAPTTAATTTATSTAPTS
jgi:serine/threonine-protein kinase